MESNSEAPSELSEIREQLEGLRVQFDEKIKYDSHKDKQIDRLHEELQDYKRDLLANALRPILSGLIRLNNDALRLLCEIDRAGEALPPERVADIVSSFVDDVERLLLDQGVLSFEDYAEGERFNPRRQQSVGFEKSQDPEDVGLIAERVRPGYEYGSILLQKERVRVFKVSDVIDVPPPSPAAPVDTQPSVSSADTTDPASPSPEDSATSKETPSNETGSTEYSEQETVGVDEGPSEPRG